MKTISIRTGHPYDVLIGQDILKLAGKEIAALPGQHYKTIAVVTDDRVEALYAAPLLEALRQKGFAVCCFAFPNGEQSKSMQTANEIIEFLIQKTITRSDLIVALGGGVVGDLAGFVASIYLRGIDYVQFPTTLLAAVDSSVGGKTAVNIPAGKNLVGSFWQPRLVLCDVNTLKTLDDDVFGDGVAETIKYGCIWDEALFRQLEEEGIRPHLADIISRCVEIKAQVVAEDERDNALRQILNFGHTMGHGVEKLSRFSISHGKGVAIGMCLAAAAGEAAGITPAGSARRIHNLLEKNSLPTSSPYEIDELAQACLGDKKRSGDTINLVLLQRIGKALIHPVQASGLAEFLQQTGEGR